MGRAELFAGAITARAFAKTMSETDVRAVMTVLHHCSDADEAREMLSMLGLHDPSRVATHDHLDPTRATQAKLRAERSAAISEPGTST